MENAVNLNEYMIGLFDSTKTGLRCVFFQCSTCRGVDDNSGEAK